MVHFKPVTILNNNQRMGYILLYLKQFISIYYQPLLNLTIYSINTMDSVNTKRGCLNETASFLYLINYLTSRT